MTKTSFYFQVIAWTAQDLLNYLSSVIGQNFEVGVVNIV